MNSIAEKLVKIAENEPKVYEAGRKKEYDAFWDVCQNNGKRDDYQYAFANIGWNDETFKPKYDMILKAGYGGTNMFNMSYITDLSSALEKQGVKLDTSNCGYMSSMFNSAKVTRVPVLNLTKAHEYNNGISYIFNSASALETIDKLIVTDELTWNQCFNKTTSLKNIVIEGTIGQNGFDIHWSTGLTADSLKSIITALSPTTTGLSITLPTTAQANYEAVYGAGSWATLTATRSNWTIAYA
jgi:hypothetical protein